MGKVAILRWLPLFGSVAALATAAPLAWDKGFDAFLFTFMLYLPAVLVLCTCLGVWAAIEWKSVRGRSARRTLAAILVLIPFTFYIVPRVKDEVRFIIWSQSHGDVLRDFANRDAIILEWDSWGMAGMENDSYLASNPGDNLGEPNTAPQWLRHVGSICEIVDTKRLARSLYIVTTYNCPLR
jgi:hypothetical protein